MKKKLQLQLQFTVLQLHVNMCTERYKIEDGGLSISSCTIFCKKKLVLIADKLEHNNYNNSVDYM